MMLWYTYTVLDMNISILVQILFSETFPTIYNTPYLSKKFSLTYTMFEVSDGNSLSQRFRKGYH